MQLNAMLDSDDTSEHIRPIVITPQISPRGSYNTSRGRCGVKHCLPNIKILLITINRPNK